MRQYIPLATFVMAWGTEALSALTTFVKNNPTVGAFTFRPLQGLIDWRFMKSVITAISQPKANVHHMSQAISKAVKMMWIHWHTHHPHLTNEIHADRSMLHKFHGVILTSSHLFITGSPADLDKLKTALQVKDMRVSLGKWKVPLSAQAEIDHFPSLEVLKKAPLWVSAEFQSLRMFLTSPPLRTEVEAIGLRLTQIRVENTRTRLQCWVAGDGVPKESASLKFRAALIDLTDKSNKFIEDMKSVDGLAVMLNLPVMILGAREVVSLMRAKLMELWGAARVDVCRLIDVYHGESDAEYTMGKLVLCMMIPAVYEVPKVCLMRCIA